jgi:hypothetical protein
MGFPMRSVTTNGTSIRSVSTRISSSSGFVCPYKVGAAAQKMSASNSEYETCRKYMFSRSYFYLMNILAETGR